MAKIEIGGFKFKGGKIILLLTAFTTLGGGSWTAFEMYKDYMDMKGIVSNIDVDKITAENKLVITKLNEAIDYSRSIKNDLRDDFNRMEKNVDRIEDMVREQETEVATMIDNASVRFDYKRDSLYNDTEIKIKSLENRLTTKIQLVLDNPLSND